MITIKNFKKIKEKLAILSTFPDLPFAEDLTGEDYIEIYKIFEKIENGILTELPCKVGDKVYKVITDFIVEYRVHKIEFHITEDKQFGYCLFCDNYDLGDFDYFYKKSIGKEVFLTKAAAKQKLKELKGEQK